ncbi:hypothetical protein BKA60DRAFT_587202, partial [Fusarium oxysporum]
MEAQGHRVFSGTCDRLTSAGEQLKSAWRVTKWSERTIANGQSLAVVCFLNCEVTRFTPQTIL